ncbi:hypothetical protein ABEB36_014576 [Hypothenemus hampei]|uniref:Transposable element P transposase-like RNase H domain-containing protein n=1 Tax=Hypothenemus hampei TaxID=57062 RepID=A0ABD1E281_HYPHA
MGKPVPKNCRKLKLNAVPTLNLPACEGTIMVQKSESTEEMEKRNRALLVEEIIKEHENSNQIMVSRGFGCDISSEIVNNYSNIETKNQGIQTNHDDRDQLIDQLKLRIAEMEREKESDTEALNKIFTKTQIKKIKNRGQRTKWTIEDISKSIVIYSAGARAYRLLLKKGFPFPAVSTLRSWLKNIKMQPGIQKKVFSVIKLLEMESNEKVCVISFDEMKIRSTYCYDKSNDETVKPKSYVQTIMLRGLFSNWKQPIFYDFDCKITQKICSRFSSCWSDK